MSVSMVAPKLSVGVIKFLLALTLAEVQGQHWRTIKRQLNHGVESGGGTAQLHDLCMCPDRTLIMQMVASGSPPLSPLRRKMFRVIGGCMVWKSLD
eukprot:3689946-Amphidinium_carterae.1